MAYEKIKLVFAAISGDIYMARVNNGTMDTRNRRIATQDVMRASAEWFIGNKKTIAHFDGFGWLSWVPENKNVTNQGVKAYINNLQNINKPVDEDDLANMYQKAKAFDEIMKVSKKFKDDSNIISEFQSNVDTILDRYEDDVNHE